MQDKQRQDYVEHLIREGFFVLVLVFLLLSAGCQDTQTPAITSPPLTPTATSALSIPETDPTIVQELPITSGTFDMGTAGFIPPGYPDASDQAWSTFLTEGASRYGGLFGVHVNPGAQPDGDGIPQQVKLAFEQMKGVNVYVAFAVNHEQGPFTKERGEILRRAAVATARKSPPVPFPEGGKQCPVPLSARLFSALCKDSPGYL